MFCPECKSEYRPGFTHCRDCDVDLVAELQSQANNEPANHKVQDLRTVWQGGNENECSLVCGRLSNEGIDSEVSQASGSLQGTGDWKYAVAVAPLDYERAKTALESLMALEDADPSAFELDEGDGDLLTGDDSAARDLYFSRWYPEDATAEVYSNENAELSSMIVACLKENFIRSRSEAQQDGTTTIFVFPEDVPRARKIIREIEESTPQD